MYMSPGYLKTLRQTRKGDQTLAQDISDLISPNYLGNPIGCRYAGQDNKWMRDA